MGEDVKILDLRHLRFTASLMAESVSLLCHQQRSIPMNEHNTILPI